MQIPQPLPPRSVDLATDEAEALGAAQPERGRQYVQTGPGRFLGRLSERWGAAVRVRCARAKSYVVFSLVDAVAPATWCGIPLDRRSVIELAVENRLLENGGASAEWLSRCMASALAAVERSDAAWQALRDDFLHLAARLRRPSDPQKVRIESWSSRRAAVRRVGEFLDAQQRELPSLAGLCAIAGVSERTLEYAFQEEVGIPPGRYLRLRRLNHARQELLAADPATTRVTDVGLRWGFWQLGRFAAEYRALLGERPSETLARGAVASVRPSIALSSISTG